MVRRVLVASAIVAVLLGSGAAAAANAEDLPPRIDRPSDDIVVAPPGLPSEISPDLPDICAEIDCVFVLGPSDATSVFVPGSGE